IKAIGRPEFLKALFRFRLIEAARIINLPFLASILTGIVIAVLSLATVMKWLLTNEPVLLWSFFFGLILASVFIVSKRIKRWSAGLVTSLILGTVGAFFLVGLVPTQTPNQLWFIFLSGALAISAMILPGISGAFILVLL